MANIPPIALSIPDFEGEAILRIFSNTSHEEIACYSAVVTNGASFGQPEAVGSILGIFTFVAMIASFTTAIYGEAVPTMRLHYAHSLSVGVVFAVWQHIFFTGALSVNWPSVLVAWWSNFAWAGGMIYSSSMQSSIDNLIGHNIGNTSQVGAAQAGSANSGVGGGYDISSIYKRALSGGVEGAMNHPLFRDIASEIYNRAPRRDLVQRGIERTLFRRDNTIADSSDGYHWYGHPVKNGLPLPGNYSGFSGTLAEEGIAVSNAFMTGFLWFLILLVLLVAATMAFKWILEGLARIKWVKEDRLKFFRDHWLGYSGLVALRTCFIGWFMMMFLTIFQFTYDSSGGVKGIAAIVFIVFFVGLPATAAYAVWYKWNVTDYNDGPRSERNKLLGGRLPIPRFGMKKSAHTTVTEESGENGATEANSGKQSIWKRMTTAVMNPNDTARSIHDDEDYTMKFGWLASRFRRTRWWFFTAWMFYTFLEAIFYGGASGYAQAQVFGLLVIEFLAFCFIIWAKPFEGQRLNILVVYCLGFSKVASIALSAAFDVQFNLQRITTTVIGVVIIVIQGILTIITMIAIVIGAITSYMSVSRNREEFRPKKWHGLRERYFNHLDRTVNDLPPEPKPKKEKKEPPPPPEEPKYGFEMKNVRRLAKIEDEDDEFVSEMRSIDPNASYMSVNDDAPSTPGFGPRSGNGTPVNRSRANSRAQSVASMSQTNLPYGARAHRPSWSQRDFTPVDTFAGDRDSTPIDMTQNIPEDEPARPPSAKNNSRTPSRSATMPVALNAKPSVDSLNVGGDVSTRDTIGKVPAPTVRPRAGSYSYNRQSAHSMSDANRSSDHLADVPNSPPGSQRNSMIRGGPSGSYGRNQPLTPAQEMDEWAITKTNSRQEE